jgi:hypothetical protein
MFFWRTMIATFYGSTSQEANTVETWINDVFLAYGEPDSMWYHEPPGYWLQDMMIEKEAAGKSEQFKSTIRWNLSGLNREINSFDENFDWALYKTRVMEVIQNSAGDD